MQGVGSGPDARVQVLSGLSGDLLPRLRELAGLAAGSAEGPPPLSFVFLDHCKPVSGGAQGDADAAAHDEFQAAAARDPARLLTCLHPVSYTLHPCALQCYLPDLLSLERLGLVGAGSLVLADNVVVPGTPDYLAHVRAPLALPRGAGSVGAGGGAADVGAAVAALEAAAADSGGAAGGRSSSSGGSAAADAAADAAAAPEGGYAYRSTLLATAFEVEERYKAGWQPVQDAMALSLCVAAA